MQHIICDRAAGDGHGRNRRPDQSHGQRDHIWYLKQKADRHQQDNQCIFRRKPQIKQKHKQKSRSQHDCALQIKGVQMKHDKQCRHDYDEIHRHKGTHQCHDQNHCHLINAVHISQTGVDHQQCDQRQYKFQDRCNIHFIFTIQSH